MKLVISSLPMDAKKINDIVRSHWGMENGLSRLTAGCLDIAFLENESRVREGHAPENPALLSRIAASLIKQDTVREAGAFACSKKASWNQDYLLHFLRLI